MSVKFEGLDELERELEKRFGRKAMQAITDKALIAGAKVIIDEIKRQLKPSERSGALIDEITHSEPYWSGGKRTVRIMWEGPNNRYTLVHLIEYGHFGKHGFFVKPKAQGGINRAVKQGQRKYTETVKRELKKL